MASTHSAQQYRAFADQCLDRAKIAVSSADRQFMLERAKIWRRLAAAKDQAAEDRRSTRRFPARQSSGNHP
jgi:hypothetical protein